MTALRALLTILALVAGGPAAADEAYPTRPITIIVPFPPGGIADLTARPLAAALERRFKQPVVVSNKAGAAGAVGMQTDEFKTWWDHEAAMLARVTKQIGKIEAKYTCGSTSTPT